jgi:hypothetical protein
VRLPAGSFFIGIAVDLPVCPAADSVRQAASAPVSFLIFYRRRASFFYRKRYFILTGKEILFLPEKNFNFYRKRT